MCLNIHHFHCNGISYPTITTTLKVDRDFDPSHRNHCSLSPLGPDTNTVAALVERSGFIVVMFSSSAVMSRLALCCSSDMV